MPSGIGHPASLHASPNHQPLPGLVIPLYGWLRPRGTHLATYSSTSQVTRREYSHSECDPFSPPPQSCTLTHVSSDLSRESAYAPFTQSHLLCYHWPGITRQLTLQVMVTPHIPLPHMGSPYLRHSLLLCQVGSLPSVREDTAV